MGYRALSSRSSSAWLSWARCGLTRSGTGDEFHRTHLKRSRHRRVEWTHGVLQNQQERDMKLTTKAMFTAVLAFAASSAFAAGGEIAAIVKSADSNDLENLNKGATAAMAEGKCHPMRFHGP